MGDLDRALAHAERSCELGPWFTDSQFTHAVILYDLSRLDDARKVLLNLADSEPSERAFHYLGLVEEKQGNLAQALRWYSLTLETDPGNTQTRFNLASLLTRQGRLREAAVQYGRILQDEPGHLKALLNLGHALALMGRPEDAGKIYEKALEVEPGNPRAIRELEFLRQDASRPRPPE
ncbi:MAG: tetratricopeptide repeat protein [Pseudomonadota bacterium]